MNFDRVARVYRLLERLVFGEALQVAREAHLESVCHQPRVLVLGDGDGRFLGALLAQRPRAQVDLIEASAKMIEQAKQRVPGGAVVAFEQVDVLECARSDRYDLIVSHFFLDCFELEQIEQIVTRFTANLEPGGEWLIADFQIPENGRFWRLRARCLLWIMYRFFRLMTGLRAPALLDPQPVLEAAGLVLDRRVVSNCGFIRSDRWKRKR